MAYLVSYGSVPLKHHLFIHLAGKECFDSGCEHIRMLFYIPALLHMVKGRVSTP